MWLMLLLFTPIYCMGFEETTWNQLHTLKDANRSCSWQEAKQKLFSYPTILYPYEWLTPCLVQLKIERLPFFCYGSLMDVKSAYRTLSLSSLATYRPAIAFGVKRLFNRDVPLQAPSKWCLPENARSRAMLNVEATPTFSSIANGILIDGMVQDLPALMQREVGYDLMPVIVGDWHRLIAGDKQPYSIAYTFQARKSEYVSNNILPRPGYYELCRNAAQNFGPLFLHLWFATTFLADGKTPIEYWERALERSAPATQCETR